MHSSVRNVDKCGQIAPQIEEGVSLHRRLVLPKVCPGEDRQAQIDGRGVERVERTIKTFEKRIIIVIQRTCTFDECLCKGFVHSPIALLVGVVQSGELDTCCEAEVIQLFRMSVDAEDDAARTFSKRELPKTEAEKLLPARKGFHGMISLVHVDAFLKIIP